MEKMMDLLKSKGVLSDLPNTRTAAAVSVAIRISKDKELERAFSEFAFNYAITAIVDKVNIPPLIKKMNDDVDMLFNSILEDIFSDKNNKKEGKK